jgi:hypothetical protein
MTHNFLTVKPASPRLQTNWVCYFRQFIHLHASAICISKLDRVGFQPRSACAPLASPINTGGSPGRRATVSDEILPPQTLSAAAITFFTE